MINLQLKDVTTETETDQLIKNISFTLKAGSVTALVGHNGAGKSTLIKTIMGLFEKTHGKITIMERYDQEKHLLVFKQHLSYLPEEPMLLTELTAMQHFQLYGMSYGINEEELHERIDRYVQGFELVDKLNDYPESLSKGMRQKVQTICALLPKTKILLIDEPFMGLDIYAIDYLMELIKEKKNNGSSILLSTHQLELVKDVADKFILLQQGQIIDQGDISEFQTIRRGTLK